MKKITSLVLVAILIGFVIGEYASAGGNVVEILWGRMNGNIKGTTDTKLDSMTTDIETALSTTFNSVETYQTNWATTQIEAYYTEQLAKIKDNPEVNIALNDLTARVSLLIAEEKARIDAAISAALGGQ